MEIGDWKEGFSGPYEFVWRLGDDWYDLALVLNIPGHVQDRFDRGREAYAIWDLLVRRNQLNSLAPALRTIGRDDLVDAVAQLSQETASGWIIDGPEGPEGASGHFTQRGRGQSSYARGGDLFRGRAAALSAVEDWLTADWRGRALVVTGQPGAGKSAVVARATLNAVAGRPDERGLAFHARDATIGDFFAAVARLMGTVPAGTVTELVDGMRLVSEFRVVIDALDEAATDTDRRQLVRAVVELAALRHCRVVVATRTRAVGNRFGPRTLLHRLRVGSATASNLVDLDDDRYFDPGDLRSFATAVLDQTGVDTPAPANGAWAVYRANPSLRDRLGRAVAGRAGRNYLVAALTADLLSQADEPVDPAAPGFDRTVLPTSLEEAVDKYFDQLPEEKRARIQVLLTALAYARGVGVDDSLWLAFAEQLGVSATSTDLDLLRTSTAADYLLWTTRASDAPATRLFHQALADELVARRDRGHDERLIARALDPAPANGSAPHPYVRSHYIQHVAAAGWLDDDHVPVTFLPYETGGEVGVSLGKPAPLGPRHRRLAAWAAIEPYVGDLDLAARRLSLEFAVHAMSSAAERARLTLQSPMHPLWTCWRLTSNVLVHLSDQVAIRSVSAFVGLDGRHLLATGCSDSAVRVWDVTTGMQVGPSLTDPEATLSRWGVAAIVTDDDRLLVAAGGGDGVVHTWDFETSTHQGLRGHTGKVRGLTAFRDDRGRPRLASAGHDQTVRIWDANSGTPVGDPLVGHAAAVQTVAAYTDSEGTTRLATGSVDGILRLWDVATGRPVSESIRAHIGCVWTVQPLIDHEGQRTLATAGDDRTIRFWNPDTGDPTGTPLTVSLGRITALTTAMDGGDPLLVSASSHRQIRVWSLASRAETTPPKLGHRNWVVSLTTTTSTTGRQIIASAGGADGTVRLWDPVTAEPETSVQELGWVRGAAWTRDLQGRPILATCSGDRRIRLWEGESGEEVGEPLVGHQDWVRTVAAFPRPDGRQCLVTGSDDSTVRLWDVADATPIGASLTGHTAALWAVTAFTDHQGRCQVVSGGNDLSIRIWDVDRAELIHILTGHTRGVRGLTTIDVGGERVLLASVGADHTLRTWDTTTGQAVGDPIIAHSEGIRAVAAFHVDGQPRLATAGCDQMVRIWDPLTGAQVGELVGHSGWVLTIAAATHACGRTVLLTGGGEGDLTVRVWDPLAQRELARLLVAVAVQGIAVDPTTADADPLIAIVGVAGVAVLRVDLASICLSPACRSRA